MISLLKGAGQKGKENGVREGNSVSRALIALLRKPTGTLTPFSALMSTPPLENVKVSEIIRKLGCSHAHPRRGADQAISESKWMYGANIDAKSLTRFCECTLYALLRTLLSEE